MKRACCVIPLVTAVAAAAVGPAAVPARLGRYGTGTAQGGLISTGTDSLLFKRNEIEQCALLRHMGFRCQRIMTGGADRSGRCGIGVVVGTGQIGSGQNRRRQHILIQGDGKG